ncbi:hypothetical protein JTE90_023007 [Oedothorax gibbosus]|uniref:C2H2-type domain-containing protein n=1 Tax=Oedothorax gibbosus TaxID=931172 RepID=A0AAV6U971_9ARAC|nr:hypothetical protein JTE90_023007 [Oedothorax gibbosus]
MADDVFVLMMTRHDILDFYKPQHSTVTYINVKVSNNKHFYKNNYCYYGILVLESLGKTWSLLKWIVLEYKYCFTLLTMFEVYSEVRATLSAKVIGAIEGSVLDAIRQCVLTATIEQVIIGTSTQYQLCGTLDGILIAKTRLEEMMGSLQVKKIAIEPTDLDSTTLSEENSSLADEGNTSCDKDKTSCLSDDKERETNASSNGYMSTNTESSSMRTLRPKQALSKKLRLFLKERPRGSARLAKQLRSLKKAATRRHDPEWLSENLQQMKLATEDSDLDSTGTDMKVKAPTRRPCKARNYEAVSDVKYSCDLCPFKTKRSSHLVKHMTGHEKVLCCPHCSYQTTKKRYYDRHLRLHCHKRTSLHQCTECSYKTHRKKMASTTKRKIHQYSEAALEEAWQELSTIRAASRKFGVPRGTLQDRIHGRVSEGPRKMGPDAVLTLAEEKKLVQWIKDLVKCGFPRKVEDLLNTVQKIILDDGRKNPFKNGRPGKKWYASFLKRNPGLEHRVSQGVSKGRAIVTEEAIKKWFKELEDFLKNMTILIYLNIQAGYLMEMKLRLACVPKLAREHFHRHTKSVHGTDRPHLCHICGKSFKRGDNLLQHSHLHSDSTPDHECTTCGKNFRSQSHLIEHRAVHSEHRNFLCEVCGASFKTKSVHRKHVQSIHRNPKAFPCDVCFKKFNTQYTLKRHKKTHLAKPKLLAEPTDLSATEKDSDVPGIPYNSPQSASESDPGLMVNMPVPSVAAMQQPTISMINPPVPVVPVFSVSTNVLATNVLQQLQQPLLPTTEPSAVVYLGNSFPQL